VIHHLVLIQLVDSATDADRQAIVEALNALPKSIPEMQSCACSEVVVPPTGGASWDVGYTSTFATMEDYLTYSAHPAHRRVGTDLIMPVRANSVSAQFEVS